MTVYYRNLFLGPQKQAHLVMWSLQSCRNHNLLRVKVSFHFLFPFFFLFFRTNVDLLFIYLVGQIHEENVQKISSMTINEIAQAQQDLLKSLDPSLVNMLKGRTKRKQPEQKPLNSPQVLPEAMEPDTENNTTPHQEKIPSANNASQSTATSIIPKTDPLVPQHTIEKKLPVLTQPNVPQPLKKIFKSPQEQEQYRLQQLEKRRIRQEQLRQEMHTEYQESTKSIIELAEGVPSEQIIPVNNELKAADNPVGVAGYRFDFEGNIIGIIIFEN